MPLSIAERNRLDNAVVQVEAATTPLFAESRA